MHLNDLDSDALDLGEKTADPSPATTTDTSPGLPSASNLGIDSVTTRLAVFTAQLTAIAGERTQAEREAREARQNISLSAVREREQVQAAAATEPDPLAQLPQRLERLVTQQQRLLAGVTDAAQRRRLRLRAECDRACAVLEAAPVDLANDPAHQQTLARSADLSKKLELFLADLASLTARNSVLETSFTTACRRARITGCIAPAPGANTRMPLRERLKAATALLADAEAKLLKLKRSSPYQDTSLGGQILNHGLIVFAHAMAASIAWFAIPEALPWIAGSGVITQGLVPLRTRGQRRQLGNLLVDVRPILAGIAGALQQLERAGRTELDPQGPMQPRVDRLLRADKDRVAEQDRLRAHTETAVARIRKRELQIRERLEARSRTAATIVLATATAESTARNARHAALLATCEQLIATRLTTHDQAWSTRQADFDARWNDALAALKTYAAESCQELLSRHPTWSDDSWTRWTSSLLFAPDLPLGVVQIPVSTLAAACGRTVPSNDTTVITLPVALAFPSPASLLVRCGPEGRSAGLRLIHQVLVRALVSFPAGKLRLVLIDPLGLGEAFSPLLDLAEHEESLLGDGVLNDVVAIERGLDDLVAHLETVIQKRLRGRYATIEDYNRQAGELQEPLHVVAVADFPNGFSERGLERLALLARTGARCGVHVVVLHDDRRTLPAVLDLAWFRRTGVILRALQDRLVLDRDGLQDWTFSADAPAATPLLQKLLAAVGSAADGAQRVELGFAAVAPSAEELWSKSSAKGLSIPLGKRGPDRLQMLDLGRGTAQHVLIGGRTGSGKSTLLHVLITSAALWYAPSEVEFHLIDFKKGVEFKAYATHRLPHARVVAIESDREFGLSVLRQLDREMTSRGESFRAVGAQDLAAHRATGGAHLPRILLIIDEFQEFFTEDDAIARDAALLLDRFVRQGRAFGVHVILGSQTLAGSYSLAKSSLGQMGVRIALPCNEADAHLLLHEDNDATRLLTRPGDAVYNDQAGMAAGNSPFQVCWLSDEQEAGHLRPLAARATAANWKPLQPPVFFEGSAPSDLNDAPITTNTSAVWVGQSSSLSGAAKVPFQPAAAGNVLIVGQNREAAAATCAALFLGFVGSPGARLMALDGEDTDGPFGAIATGLTPLVQRYGAKDAAAVLGDLSTLLERRQSGDDSSRSSILLVVFALQRQRALRPDDDGGFGSDSGRKPSDLLATLLANGSEYGIHIVVWCDSLASVQRGLGRKAVRDFDARILFQMAAGDSSELIDEDTASRLGLHNALLAVESDGRREKFRPCSLPSAAVLSRLATRRVTRH